MDGMSDKPGGSSRLNKTNSVGTSIGHDKDPTRIAAMFDDIADRYDILNHILSVGLDYRWRARAVSVLTLSGTETLLDLCTGTADLAIAAAKRGNGNPGRVIGIDFSERMLRFGQTKLREAHIRCVQLTQADAAHIPLIDGSVDAVVIGFGIRNVLDLGRVCAEVSRVLRPGGQLVIIEFGVPRRRSLGSFIYWYVRRVLPWIGRIISRHQKAYTYLPASISAFSSPVALSKLLRASGFSVLQISSLTFGMVYLYVATKDLVHPLN